ncbi:hypothetical protein TNCV_266071 [Trichonephila clavipes]|nr:hypothetical protein TNCV_266071 [Trichonephila clavipes]
MIMFIFDLIVPMYAENYDNRLTMTGEKSLENRERRLGRPRDFCDLPIRRDEGRVVNTPLVFKRVLFQEKRKETKKEKKKESGERERKAGLGWRKGLSLRLEWKDDERRWRCE